MLGLLVLLGLIVWIAITLVSIKGGAILGKAFIKRKNAQYIGAFLGFMLTMGGFIFYWTVEYFMIQQRVSYLCKTEAGLKIFVTPEDYKRRLLESDWGGLPKYAPQVKGQFKNTYITYNRIDYELNPKSRDQIQDLSNSEDLHLHVPYVKDWSVITYDTESKVILAQLIEYNVSAGSIANEWSAFKFWMNNIQDCSWKSKEKERFNLKKQYASYIDQESNHE
jgi:hypothetical protein